MNCLVEGVQPLVDYKLDLNGLNICLMLFWELSCMAF